jgi:glycosyltransferase involved in cell wall biosynthesis
VLIVSHPSVVATNQLPYLALRQYGWDPFIVTPSVWHHDYAAGRFHPEILPEMAGRLIGRRVAFSGRVQRHIYLTRVAGLISQVGPLVAFIEEEPTSVPSTQWGRALHRAGVPFGVQADENLDRAYPIPARAFRRWTLHHAAFVACRSPKAATLVESFVADVPTPLIPHHVPAWRCVTVRPRRTFVIGYAGRLVEEKGLDVLIDAASGLEGVELRFVGNGPLLGALKSRAGPNVRLHIDTSVGSTDMAAAYASFDVLVLPSKTTSKWAEQFGRVLVEALWCGVPVIGSDSGEIPWVIRTTGGGLVFPEGDVAALRTTLVRLRDDVALRHGLAARGRERVEARFSVDAVARALDASLRSAMRSRS